MAFTRAQANDLLNKSEMALFDDSRANALRRLDRAALAGRVERTRAARDRARDLLKRQRLAARKRGEGKADGIAARTARKEALLVEVLQRFVEARRDAPAVTAKKAAGKAVKKAAVAAKTSSGKSASKKAVARKAAAGTGAATKKAATSASRKPAVKKSPAKKAPSKKSTKAAAEPKAASAKKAPAKKRASRRALTPERALENTRSLLESKHERDRTPQPWQSLDPAADHSPEPGYQSPQAASKAKELHAGEARLAPIHGSISTRDRRNQGKRDHRNGGSE